MKKRKGHFETALEWVEDNILVARTMSDDDLRLALQKEGFNEVAVSNALDVLNRERKL